MKILMILANEELAEFLQSCTEAGVTPTYMGNPTGYTMAFSAASGLNMKQSPHISVYGFTIEEITKLVIHASADLPNPTTDKIVEAHKKLAALHNSLDERVKEIETMQAALLESVETLQQLRMAEDQ